MVQDTDLVAQGADVGEAAESVGDDEFGAVGHVGVGRVGLEGVVGDEFILGVLLVRSSLAEYGGRKKKKEGKKRRTYRNDLQPDQLRDLEQIPVTGNSKQEGDRITDIPNDQLDGQWRIVDIQIMAPPGQQSVAKTDEGDDTEQRRAHHACNLDTQPGTVGKGVQSVSRAVLVVVRNDDTAGSQGLFFLWPAHLGDGK